MLGRCKLSLKDPKVYKLEHNTYTQKLILKLEQVSFQVPKVEKHETNLLAISMPGIGACKMQTQFKSSKSVKTLTQYLNTKLDLKT